MVSVIEMQTMKENENRHNLIIRCTCAIQGKSGLTYNANLKHLKHSYLFRKEGTKLLDFQENGY